MKQKLLGIESKHWMIGAWILALGLTFCDIVNTTDILGIILRMIALISLGFGTYYYGKGKQQDSLIYKFGGNMICNEFRKFKGLTFDTYVSFEQINDYVFVIHETNKPTELYGVVFNVKEDMTPGVEFIEFSEETLNKIKNKEI